MTFQKVILFLFLVFSTGLLSAQEAAMSTKQLSVKSNLYKSTHYEGGVKIKYREFKKIIKSDSLAAIQFKGGEQLVGLGDAVGLIAGTGLAASVLIINQSNSSRNSASPTRESNTFNEIGIFMSACGTLVLASYLMNTIGKEKKLQAMHTYNRNRSKEMSLDLKLGITQLGFTLIF